MKLWLDDVRLPPDETWTWAATADQAIALMRYGREPLEAVSLDFDLGPGPTGEKVADYIARMVRRKGDVAPKDVQIHSMNPVGAAKMRAILDGPCPEEET